MNRFLKKDFRVMLVGLLLLASCQEIGRAHV